MHNGWMLLSLFCFAFVQGKTEFLQVWIFLYTFLCLRSVLTSSFVAPPATECKRLSVCVLPIVVALASVAFACGQSARWFHYSAAEVVVSLTGFFSIIFLLLVIIFLCSFFFLHLLFLYIFSLPFYCFHLPSSIVFCVSLKQMSLRATL